MENFTDEMGHFIDTVETILETYQRETYSFNIFKMSKIYDKELPICSFIVELINTKQFSEKNVIFLEEFMKIVLGISNIPREELLKANVQTEYVIHNSRRIDIFIQMSNRYIGIEVKIYASDQNKQCYDYYEFLKDMANKTKGTFDLYYLTLDGHCPDKESCCELKANEDYKIISFDKHILNWVKSLKEKTSDLELLHTLIQFESVIKYLTGHEDRRFAKKMVEKDFDMKKYLIAQKIEKAMPFIRINKMKEFFAAIENDLTKYKEKFGFDIRCNYKDFAEKYYKDKKVRPGISLVLPRLSDAPNYEFLLRLEIDNNLYFGVCHENTKEVLKFTENVRNNSNTDNMHYVREHSGEYFTTENDNDFYWYRYLPRGKKIDFKKCNEEYVKLYDAEESKKIIDSVCKEIIDFLNVWTN